MIVPIFNANIKLTTSFANVQTSSCDLVCSILSLSLSSHSFLSLFSSIHLSYIFNIWKHWWQSESISTSLILYSISKKIKRTPNWMKNTQNYIINFSILHKNFKVRSFLSKVKCLMLVGIKIRVAKYVLVRYGHWRFLSIVLRINSNKSIWLAIKHWVLVVAALHFLTL